MPREVDLIEFAERVERLCDYLLLKVTSNKKDDIRILQDLKEDAANIQFQNKENTLVDGLKSFMQGVPDVNKER